MLIILSFIAALIEVSLPLSNTSMVIALPFFAYIISKKKKYVIGCFIILSIVMSLQTHNFLRIFLVLTAGYFCLDFFYMNLGYQKRNIFFISLIQIGMYLLMDYKHLNIFWIIFNFIGFIVLNYFYMGRKKS